MGMNGKAALRAKELYLQGVRSAERAWEVATGEVFTSESSREKPCPKGAFLGLCAMGLVRDVAASASRAPAKSKNAQYAVTAARLLAAEPTLSQQGAGELWKRVMEELNLDTSKRHNGQMDVVLSLWTSGALTVTDAD